MLETLLCIQLTICKLFSSCQLLRCASGSGKNINFLVCVCVCLFFTFELLVLIHVIKFIYIVDFQELPYYG